MSRPCPSRLLMSRPIFGLTWAAIAAMVAACSGGESVQPRTVDDALAADFDRVASARVYFGHQSVGGNILDGVADLQRQVGRPVLRIATLGELELADGQGVLLHTAIGENERPDTKCEDFRRVLDSLAGRIDVALFKFCYIDFNDASDVDAIFATYARTMDDLKRRHPDVLFIHVTAPLRSVDRGLGVWAREMLGRVNRTKLANVRRNEFNRRLREQFADDPIFDLAAAMSTLPDGRRESFRVSGAGFDSLVPAYTNDGGHLNEVGRTHVAAAFVQSIAEGLRRGRRANATDGAPPDA